jgi:hypothetical protein
MKFWIHCIKPGLGQLKNPMTLGIKPATLWSVAVPQTENYTLDPDCDLIINS